MKVLGSTRCRSEGYFLSPGATAGTSVRICARAATRRDDVVAVSRTIAATPVDERRGSEASVMARWRFPPLQPTLSDRVRVLRWETVAAANLVS